MCTCTIAAPKLFHKERVEAPSAVDFGMDDDEKLSGEKKGDAASRGPGDMADGKFISRAPPPHLWPIEMKRWVERCFTTCRTGLERDAGQRHCCGA